MFDKPQLIVPSRPLGDVVGKSTPFIVVRESDAVRLQADLVTAGYPCQVLNAGVNSDRDEYPEDVSFIELNQAADVRKLRMWLAHWPPE